MASSIQFQDGQYGRGKVIGKWGRERNVPSTCGHSLGSRANASCQFVPTWYRTGYGWSCGKHRNVLHKMDLPPPPVVDETTPFIPFECSICISGCCQKKIRSLPAATIAFTQNVWICGLMVGDTNHHAQCVELFSHEQLRGISEQIIKYVGLTNKFSNGWLISNHQSHQ